MRGGGLGGFSLVELLVSMAVLLLVFVAVVAVIQSAAQSWTAGKSLAEAQATARAALDLAGRDLARMPLPGALPALSPDDSGDAGFRFYTLRPVAGGGDRHLALVGFFLADSGGTNGLVRREEDLSVWNADPARAPLGGNATMPAWTGNHTDLVFEPVVGVATRYLAANGTWSDSPAGALALSLSLAVLDRDALTVLEETDRRADLVDFLAGVLPVASPASPVSAWQAGLDSAGWQAGSGGPLPGPVRRGLRFFERTYPLEGSP